MACRTEAIATHIANMVAEVFCTVTVECIGTHIILRAQEAWPQDLHQAYWYAQGIEMGLLGM